MSYGHYFVIFCCGNYLQYSFSQLVENKGMVAHYFELCRQMIEQRVSRVGDKRSFTVHRFFCLDEACPEKLPDGLVAEADAKNRFGFMEPFNELHSNTGLMGCFWPRGNNGRGEIEL